MFEDLARKALARRAAGVVAEIARVTEETTAERKEVLAVALSTCWFPLLAFSRSEGTCGRCAWCSSPEAPRRRERVAEALVSRYEQLRAASSGS